MSDTRDSRPPPLVVETPQALADLARRLEAAGRVALDTEADSLHAYRERVCVVQASVPGLDAIVDPLAVSDLSPLREAVARTEVVFHGGDYDVMLLSRDHGFAFPRVFDTMVAATLLGDSQVGLAALVEAAYGVRLDKRFQKSDWGARPLTPAQVDYLRADTAHLLGLRDLYHARLVQADLLEEAEIEFRRQASKRAGTPPAEPWREMRGADRLDATGRAVLEALWAWREGHASRRDLPRFRVAHDDVLMDLATRPPASLEDLAARRGLPPYARHEGARDVLAVVRAGLDAAARGEAPLPRERRHVSDALRAAERDARRREERLRAWRTEEARRRGVPNVVVLPNPALLSIAESPPRDAEALAAHPDVGPKRAARYGETLLRLLRGGTSPA